MTKTKEQSIDAKIRRILRSETLLSDPTFRFACESFPEFPSYIASVMTGDDVSPLYVRTEEHEPGREGHHNGCHGVWR